MSFAPRPRLRPDALLAWRSPGRLQVGTGSGAVVLEGVTVTDELVIEALDGTHDTASLIRVATANGGDPERVGHLLHALSTAGALRRAEPAARRRSAIIVVVGASRAGLAVALGLAGAGVGTVLVEDDAVLTTDDTGPGAHPVTAIGTSRGQSAARVVAAAHPGTATTIGAAGTTASPTHPGGRVRPDVVVVVASGAHDVRRSEALVREGVTHLGVLVRGDAASVGPLVVPGVTCCLRCLDMHRTDRDPEWPRLLPQLAAPPGGHRRPEAPELAALAAALAVQQVLAHLQGADQPAALDATLEVRGGLVGVRPWSPHPRCGCTWAQQETRHEDSPQVQHADRPTS